MRADHVGEARVQVGDQGGEQNLEQVVLRRVLYIDHVPHNPTPDGLVAASTWRKPALDRRK
ncbi:MAG: hypothetical protein ACRDS0_22980 [Pseudonocardiaceae bacterium]